MSEQIGITPPGAAGSPGRAGAASTEAAATASDPAPAGDAVGQVLAAWGGPHPEGPASTAPAATAGSALIRPALVKLYWHLALTGLVTFAGFALAVLMARAGGVSDLMLLVLLAGASGAVINNYYRLARLASADAVSLEEMDNSVFTVQLYVSVLISGVLGYVMYGLCLSGLVAGELFPAFKGVDADYASLPALMTSVSPASNIDAVKAVVWAFIAGFSEKLIPNMIDRVADKAAARGA